MTDQPQRNPVAMPGLITRPTQEQQKMFAGNRTFYVMFTAPIVPQSCGSLLQGVAQIVAKKQADIVYIAIASPGGSVPSAIAVYNSLKALPVKFITHNIGNVDSAANILYMVGDKRYMTSNASFLFHGVTVDLQNPMSLSLEKMQELVSQVEIDHERIAEIISQKSSLEKVEVEGFFKQGKSIGSKTAIEKGLVHEISEFSIPSNNQFAII